MEEKKLTKARDPSEDEGQLPEIRASEDGEDRRCKETRRRTRFLRSCRPSRGRAVHSSRCRPSSKPPGVEAQFLETLPHSLPPFGIRRNAARGLEETEALRLRKDRNAALGVDEA